MGPNARFGMVDRAHPRRDGTQAHSTDAPSREGDSTWSRWQVFRLWAAAPGLPTRFRRQWLSGGAANSPNTAARPRRLPSPRINDLAIINPRLGPLFPFQPRRSRISPRVQGTFNSAPAYDRSQARLAPLARECQAARNRRKRPTQRATAPGEPRDLAQVLMHPSASGRRGGGALHAAEAHHGRPVFLAPALSGPPDSFSPRLIARLISLTTSRAHRLVTLPLVECAASLRPLRSCSRARSSPPRRRA
jgi:hypothetical protein